MAKRKESDAVHGTAVSDEMRVDAPAGGGPAVRTAACLFTLDLLAGAVEGFQAQHVYWTILPRHRRAFRLLRDALHAQHATFTNQQGNRQHVDSNAHVLHWLLDQVQIADSSLADESEN